MPHPSYNLVTTVAELLPTTKVGCQALECHMLVIVSSVNVGMVSKCVNDLGKGDFGS